MQRGARSAAVPTTTLLAEYLPMAHPGIHRAINTFGLSLGLVVVAAAQAGGVPTAVLEEVTVLGRLDQLIGAPISASQGVVTDEQLSQRPVLRPGELLEAVPGLVVTQHSGSGKANQFFLRGFNLDHGTDLATSVGGVPVNMPTHGHGQGYTDINFVIPELIESIQYSKGTYYAENGNFSAAGAANMRYRSALQEPMLAIVELGQDSYQRGLLGVSSELGGGNLLVGIEYSSSDGPFILEEDYRKVNGLVRFSKSGDGGRYSITAQGYEGDWNSTDQIPLRAVRSGQIDRFGFVDPTDRGDSHRYSLSVDWARDVGQGELTGLVYTVDYSLDLISNFTYFTKGEGGDQFEQVDARRIYGGDVSWSRRFQLGGRDMDFKTGVQLRHDDIDDVALYDTAARVRTNTVREDSVRQTSYSVYASFETRWAEKVRTTVGLRGDLFDFDVDSSLLANSGTETDTIASPKFSLVLGPWSKTELFFNLGEGFHSNDARGTTITLDPNDAVTQASRVDPLVKALGADIGVRTAILPNTQLTISLWSLELESELVFVGDAGATEASRESQRRGVEIGAIWNPLSWLIIDADLAFTRSRFSGADPDGAGDRIPLAVDSVASIGIAVDHPSGWFGGLRFRNFGESALIEDNSVRSNPTTVVNLETGYEISKRYRLSASVFNLFDREDNDITYFYESQLPGEAGPQQDIHFHPVEPRSVRVNITGTF
jgi:outer membrane receptor protein involved in Fe transport